MPLVDYSHDPATDLYTFRDDQGASRMAYGPEASELARYVDQTRPPRLASNDVGPPADSVMAMPPGPPPMMNDAGPQMSVAPDMPPPPSMSVGPSTIQRPPPPAPVPTPQQAAQSVALEPEPRSPIEDITSPEAVLARAYRQRWSPGRAAYDPEADAAARRPVPVSQTTTIQGELNESPEDQARRLEAERERQGVFKSALAAVGAAQQEKVAAHQASAAYFGAQAVEAEERRKALEAARAAKEAEGRRVRARLDVDLDNVRAMKVDPKRLFRTESGGINALTVIGSAIARGLGAFGAAMTGSRNFAADIIDNAIQCDIAAQEEEIGRKGGMADNALARFMRTHDLELGEAKEAIAMAQREYAAANAASLAASMGTVEAKERAATIYADMMARNQQTDMQFREMAGGRVTRTQQAQMLAPRVGSAGGPRAPTAREVAEEVELGIKMGKLTGRETDPEAIRARAEERQAQTSADKNVQEYGKRKIELNEARTQLEGYIRSLGGTVNDQGKIEWKEGDMPSTGFLDSKTPSFSSEATEVDASRAWLEANLGKKLSGATVSESQEKAIAKRLGAGNEDAARRGAEALIEEYRQAERVNDAAFGPTVVRQYWGNEDTTLQDKKERSDADQLKPAGKIKIGGVAR